MRNEPLQYLPRAGTVFYWITLRYKGSTGFVLQEDWLDLWTFVLWLLLRYAIFCVHTCPSHVQCVGVKFSKHLSDAKSCHYHYITPSASVAAELMRAAAADYNDAEDISKYIEENTNDPQRSCHHDTTSVLCTSPCILLVQGDKGWDHCWGR